MDFHSYAMNVPRNLIGQFEAKYESCFHCGGYYGPCFKEPVCGTCHDFLYTDDHRLLSAPTLPDWDPPGVWPPPPADGLANRLALLTNPRLPTGSVTPIPALLQRIPAEILQIIFRDLDDVSLFTASQVEPRWKDVIMDLFPNGRWEEFVKKRWPLYNSGDLVQDWYAKYADLMNSVSCKLCFINLAHNPVEAQGPVPEDQREYLRFFRLRSELRNMGRDDVHNPEGVAAVPLDNLRYNWLAKIHGPPQSAYEGGVFYLNLKIPKRYSCQPPVVRFFTKVFHPNISRHGDIGVDFLRDKWAGCLTILMILQSIQSLLTDPNVEEGSMEPAVAQLYRNDPNAYEQIVREWTSKYAMH